MPRPLSNVHPWHALIIRIRAFRTLKAGARYKYICFRPMLIRFILCEI